MSTLWTPQGEHPTGDEAEGFGDGGSGEGGDEAAREQLARIRAELVSTPVRDVVANHAIGLWQLALIHLGLDDESSEPDLAEAKLAIDAMASLVEGLVDRLGDHAEPLAAALTNLRMAFVRVSDESPR